jgi:hypothetical protein
VNALIAAIKEAVRVWKRERARQARRASITTPFD